MIPCILGIDTSNYTTSLALVDDERTLVHSIKIPLPVKAGERGLRQSDAIFAHIKNFPKAFQDLRAYLHEYEIVGVSVSEKPRNQEDSYMPCFLAGYDIGHAIATVNNIPLYKFSHQCGHISAGLYGSGKLDLLDQTFGAFHVSGGTTELVKVRWTDEGYDAEISGGSLDLHAGQAIDRIGVSMELAFPAGPAMDELACRWKGKFTKRGPKIEDGFVHLSGLENLASKLYADTRDKSQVAAYVLTYIANGIERMVLAFREKHGDLPIVFCGGVMSSRFIRSRLRHLPNVYFTTGNLSSDNAVGTALNGAIRKFKH